jgi:hypothetical protein
MLPYAMSQVPLLDQQTAPTSVGKIDVPPTNLTYLQTAKVRIVGPTSLSKLTHCVLDSGSQTSVLSTSIIDALKLVVIDGRNFAVSVLE